jgi:hypothetical protein
MATAEAGDNPTQLGREGDALMSEARRHPHRSVGTGHGGFVGLGPAGRPTPPAPGQRAATPRARLEAAS